MLFFFMPASASVDWVLVAAAVLPAAALMIRVYRLDRLEAEPQGLLWRLVLMGVISALLAMAEEAALTGLLNITVTENEGLYVFLMYFVIVAYAEETSKYLLLRRSTWRSPEFNCRFDGVVYAVFVSLGFAVFENILYVFHYGMQTALLRAVTAIPGHACFGVFMGVFYGMERGYENRGAAQAASICRVLTVVLPAALHGAYDYIAATQVSGWSFILFIAALFGVSYALVGRMARQDQYI